MKSGLKTHLESLFSSPIQKFIGIGGGDISTAHKIELAKGNFLVKSSSGENAQCMYLSEAKGLAQIRATKTIATPEIIAQGIFEDTSYLIMEFVASKQPHAHDFERLGRQLAQLHQVFMDLPFGNEHDNFIGSLPQSNKAYRHWPDFYVNERLVPQFNLAQENGLLSASACPTAEKMLKRCAHETGAVSASLLHGDLWSGNYLIAKDGLPYLIDPAVYVGHSEVDLAMTQLFGGFGEAFYVAYHEIIPPHDNQMVLTEIYQLYYLLVHLNLFGSSYLASVQRIMNRYF